MLTRGKKKRLYREAAESRFTEYLRKISGKDFSLLVNEFLSRQGYRIRQIKRGADGRADFVIKKRREKIYVRSAHWRDAKTDEEAVRLISEEMIDSGCAQGWFIVSGGFTLEAAAYADANNIRVMDGDRLIKAIKSNEEIAQEIGEAAGKGKHSILWPVILVVVVTLAAVGLLNTETGREFLPHESQEKEDLAENRENQQGEEQIEKESGASIEEKEYTFTDEQVKKAMEEVLEQRHQEQMQGLQEQKQLEAKRAKDRYLYEIELHSGGWVYTENLEESREEITYSEKSGVVVSLKREEVKSIRRVKVSK